MPYAIYELDAPNGESTGTVHFFDTFSCADLGAKSLPSDRFYSQPEDTGSPEILDGTCCETCDKMIHTDGITGMMEG